MQYNKSHYNIFVTHTFELKEIEGELSFKAVRIPTKLILTYDKDGAQILFSSQSEYYDPFEHRMTSKEKSSVMPPYIEFANLDINDLNSMLNYANTRGIPGSPTAAEEYLPSGVLDEKILYDITGTTQKIERSGLITHPPIYPLWKFKKDILKMRAVLDLKKIIEDNFSPELLQRYSLLCFEAGINSHKMQENRFKRKFPNNRKIFRSFPEIVFKEAINQELSGIWPMIESRNENIWSILLCKNLKQALYLTLYNDITIPTATCADPKCGKYFNIDHKGKIYCSPYCGTKVARRKHYWDKERPKRLAQTKGGLHGKKTRKG